MKVTPIVQEATEHHLPAILAIYNEVIATSTAVYSLESSTLEERRTWFRSRCSMKFPVLVVLDSANKLLWGVERRMAGVPLHSRAHGSRTA